MNITVLYATYSGGTEAAAHIAADALKEKGHTVTLSNPREMTSEKLAPADLILLCSPSWDVNGKDGQPHEDFFVFMEKMHDAHLENKPFAILGLGDSSYPHFCGAVNELELFVAGLKGKLVKPSLRVDGFFYNQTEHTEKIKSWALTLISPA